MASDAGPAWAVRAISHFLVETAVFGIRGYQMMIRPHLIGQCPFHPHCSEYAIQALRRKGLLGGLWKSGGRLLRCHPFTKGGYDPVD